MNSTVTKTTKTSPAIQPKAAGTPFFRKAGEESFFGTKGSPSFFKAPVQAKLTVSTPDDPQEKEADAVADKVMRMPDTVSVQMQDDKLQRKEEEAVHAKPEQHDGQTIQAKKEAQVGIRASCLGAVQRSAEKKGDREMLLSGEDHGGYMVSRKNTSLYHSDILRQSGRGPPAASIPFEQTLASSKGGGSALPSDTKQFMESRFSADFSGVRVHTDATAGQLSRSVNAHAFAHGNDIYFNSGKFSPGSTEGKSLFAHELTHTLQQGASKSVGAPARDAIDKTNAVSKKPGAVSNTVALASTAIHPENSYKASSKPSGISDQKEAISSGGQLSVMPTPATLSNYSVAANGSIHPSGIATKASASDQVQSKEIRKKEELHQEENQKNNSLVVTSAPGSSVSRKSAVANAVSWQVSRGTSSIQLKRITSPQADPAFTGVVNKVKTTAKQAKKHDPVTKKVKEAQYAAKPPPNEKESKAKDKKVAEMDQQEPGVFDEDKFKAALRAKIAALQLNTLKEAEDFKANNGAAAVKGDATAQVSGETDKAAGNIENKTKEAPATGSVTGKEVGPAPAPAAPVAAPAISGQQAAPKPVPAEDVSLQKESQSLDKQMADAKVTETQLNKSNEPKFTGALAEKKTAQQDAVKRPEQFRKDEKGIITSAQATAAGVGKTHLSAIAGTRQQKMGGVLSKQDEAKAKDEAAQAKIAGEINLKFNVTKTDVEGILSKLDTDVAAMFDQGINNATKSFEDYVEQEVHNFKVDRYLNQIGGSILWVKDLLLDLPEEVNVIYKRGKDRYIKAMDVVINKVAKLVVTQLNAAKKRISQGKQEIKTYVESLPKDQQSIGAKAAKDIQSQFSELEQGVNNKQNDLVDSLAAKYKAGLENVDKKIADMKEANKGLVGKAIGAIKEVIDAIIEFKNMLLNVLARAAAAIQLIIDDPIGFLGNLVAGVKQGIQNFLGNIVTHLKNGLMGWLFGTLAKAGITMPKSFDAEGIISLVLQVLGLTYANIRSRAVNIVGEKVVAGLEKAAEIFIVIKNEGVAGLWRMIKEKVERLKDTVIDAIKSFVTEKIIVAGITWLISLLNPASAFIKACKMIYDVIMFFVTRGKQIMDLVNAVIDSVTAIAKGQIGVAANAVENALGKALPVAISFLASLLGLDGISEKIKAIIAKIQAPINAAIDWVINKAVALVKAAGKLFSGGGKKEAGGPFEKSSAVVPKSIVEPNSVMVQKPQPEIVTEVGQVPDGTILYQHIGSPVEVTSNLLTEHKNAKMDDSSGTLTLPPLTASPFIQAKSLHEAAAELAKQTGLSKIILHKQNGVVRLDGSINPTVYNLATYAVPSGSASLQPLITEIQTILSAHKPDKETLISLCKEAAGRFNADVKTQTVVNPKVNPTKIEFEEKTSHEKFSTAIQFISTDDICPGCGVNTGKRSPHNVISASVLRNSVDAIGATWGVPSTDLWLVKLRGITNSTTAAAGATSEDKQCVTCEDAQGAYTLLQRASGTAGTAVPLGNQYTGMSTAQQEQISKDRIDKIISSLRTFLNLKPGTGDRPTTADFYIKIIQSGNTESFLSNLKTEIFNQSK